MCGSESIGDIGGVEVEEEGGVGVCGSESIGDIGDVVDDSVCVCGSESIGDIGGGVDKVEGGGVGVCGSGSVGDIGGGVDKGERGGVGVCGSESVGDIGGGVDEFKEEEGIVGVCDSESIGDMGGGVDEGEESGEGVSRWDAYVVVRWCDACIDSSRASSSCRSCKRWLLARQLSCWNENGGLNERSASCRTLEQATYVKPQENSFFPTSITALSRVSPWDL